MDERLWTDLRERLDAYHDIASFYLGESPNVDRMLLTTRAIAVVRAARALLDARDAEERADVAAILNAARDLMKPR